MKSQPGYVTASEAAVRLGVTHARVSQLLEDGRIPFEVRGLHRWIKLSDLEQFASIKRPSGRRPKKWSQS
jgi:excisionase family DNA binding protein